MTSDDPKPAVSEHVPDVDRAADEGERAQGDGRVRRPAAQSPPHTGYRWPPYAPVPGAYPYDPAFAPAPRAPRSRWIASQHKAAAILVSIVAAVLLLGLGAIGGAVISDYRGHGEHGGNFQSDTQVAGEGRDNANGLTGGH